VMQKVAEMVGAVVVAVVALAKEMFATRKK
jgi:hypothetical protein